MGINFRKSISLGKGVKVNLSKGGPSVSFGVKGLRFSLNSKGGASANVGIPGTGIYYNKKVNIWNTVKGLFGLGVPETVNEPKGPKRVAEADMVEAKINAQNDFIEAMKNIHKQSDELVDWNKVLKTQDTSTEDGRSVKALAEQVLAGNDDAYLTVINEMQPFSDLTEFGNDFEVGTVDDEFMGVTFNINSDDTIPDQISTQLKSGAESLKPMTKTMRNTLKRDYVLSATFRIARDTFALLPIKKLVVNAEDNILNPMTGNNEDTVILSIIFDREPFMKLNFDRIVLSEAIKNFEYNMDFKPLKGLQQVLPLK